MVIKNNKDSEKEIKKLEKSESKQKIKLGDPPKIKKQKIMDKKVIKIK